MTAELVTPIDTYSGLPLPLLPVQHELPRDDGSVANWHHHFHPSSDPALTETTGGRALRTSRIQLVPISHHNYTETAYHRFYAGPPIPTNRNEQFGMTVLACAMYVPEMAIDVSDGDPKTVHMSAEQIGRLQLIPEPEPLTALEVQRFHESHLPDSSPDEAARILEQKRSKQARLSYRNLRYGYDQVKAFFGEVVLEQDVSHLAPRAKGKFLRFGEETQGLSVLAQASRQAVETTPYRGTTVDEVYAKAREAGQLHPCMPPSAAQLVKNKLGDYTMRTKMLPALRSNLLGNPAEKVAS